MVIIALLVLNILFVLALWHMDVHSNLDRLGEKMTRGVFHIPPEKAYRYSEYILIGTLVAIDVLFVFSFLGAGHY